jgi:hypothetical protein
MHAHSLPNKIRVVMIKDDERAQGAKFSSAKVNRTRNRIKI